jgi:hypothetical protein
LNVGKNTKQGTTAKMNRIIYPCLVMLLILANGCGGERKYVPTITLTKTGPTIDAIAEFHNLYPAYDLLSGKETFGLDAPTAERVEPHEFTRQVENEFLTKLNEAGIFSRARFDPHPDVILSGRITALHEHYRPQSWATLKNLIPYGGKIAQLLRLKTHVSSGEVHLTLFVLKATGEILGTYIGKSSFNVTFTPTKNHPPAGTFLNRALSEAVHQIQDELSHDVELGKMASS